MPKEEYINIEECELRTGVSILIASKLKGPIDLKSLKMTKPSTFLYFVWLVPSGLRHGYIQRVRHQADRRRQCPLWPRNHPRRKADSRQWGNSDGRGSVAEKIVLQMLGTHRDGLWNIEMRQVLTFLTVAAKTWSLFYLPLTWAYTTLPS